MGKRKRSEQTPTAKSHHSVMHFCRNNETDLKEELQIRSKSFRTLVLPLLTEKILPSSLGIYNNPLPEPFDFAIKLRRIAYDSILTWCEKFHSEYNQLEILRKMLQDKKPFENSTSASSSAQVSDHPSSMSFYCPIPGQEAKLSRERQTRKRIQSITEAKVKPLLYQYRNALQAQISSSIEQMNHLFDALVPLRIDRIDQIDSKISNTPSTPSTSLETSELEVKETMKRAGIVSSDYRLSVTLDPLNIIPETEENTVIFDSLRDLYVESSTRHVPFLQNLAALLSKWEPEDVTERRLKNDDLRSILDQKNLLSGNLFKCENLNASFKYLFP